MEQPVFMECFTVEGSLVYYNLTRRAADEPAPPGKWDYVLRPGSVTHIEDDESNATITMLPDTPYTLYVRKLYGLVIGGPNNRIEGCIYS